MVVNDCTLIEALCCKEDDSIVDVAQEIRKHLIRHIYVVNSDGKPVGVISNTDMNNRVVAEGKDPNTVKAKDIMTSSIVSVEYDLDEKDAYGICVKNEIATCPVTKNGKVIGIVTINELVRKLTKVE